MQGQGQGQGQRHGSIRDRGSGMAASGTGAGAEEGGRGSGVRWGRGGGGKGGVTAQPGVGCRACQGQHLHGIHTCPGCGVSTSPGCSMPTCPGCNRPTASSATSPTQSATMPTKQAGPSSVDRTSATACRLYSFCICCLLSRLGSGRPKWLAKMTCISHGLTCLLVLTGRTGRGAVFFSGDFGNFKLTLRPAGCLKQI